MSQILSQASSLVWGMPLLIFLISASLILLYHSKFVPIKGIKHSILLIKKKSNRDLTKGEVSHFEALCNALAATIGLGNISGVAVAIYQGGAGAIFWMWIAAFLGMNTKFFECTLAVLFRGKDYEGNTQGGPMYYIENGMGSKYKVLSYMFAICGVIGTLSLFQINQLSAFVSSEYNIGGLATGVFFAALIFYILIGGLKRISQITSKLVPIMSVLYALMCLLILFMNYEKVASTFASIFIEALSGKSIGGGVLGYSVMHIMKTGIKRAAFSNEAGIGTAPMAHGNAKTDEPISEGYVAMLGPLVDTIIVCTLTALTILVSLDTSMDNLNGINLTSSVFQKNLGIFGKHGLGIIILLFSFSTMIGMANYNKKCWDYLFKGKYYLGNKTFIAFYSLSLIGGAVIKMGSVIDLIDIAYALMAVPNIVAVVYLAPQVKIRLKEYNKKYQV